MTPEQWGEYIAGQIVMPDAEQREWLKRQIAEIARDAARAATVDLRLTLEKIARRRPCLRRAGVAFFRSRQDAKDALRRLADALGDEQE